MKLTLKKVDTFLNVKIDRAYFFYAHSQCNSLPFEFDPLPTITSFTVPLKTYLFLRCAVC